MLSLSDTVKHAYSSLGPKAICIILLFIVVSCLCVAYVFCTLDGMEENVLYLLRLKHSIYMLRIIFEQQSVYAPF